VAQITVPTEFTTPPEGGGGIFPAGYFKGKVQTNTNDRIRSVPWDETERRLSIWLGENEALDGKDPGAQIYFADITIERDGCTFHNLENASDNGKVALQVGLRRLTEFATAVDWVSANGAEPEVSFDVDALVKSIADGDFDGTAVKFRTWHQPSKKDKTKIYVNLAGFWPSD